METRDSGDNSKTSHQSAPGAPGGRRPRHQAPSQRASVRRFLLIFVLSFAGLMFFTYQVLYLEAIFLPWASLNSKICALLLGPFLEDVFARGDLLSAEGFSVQIRRGCDSFQASAVLLAGIFAFPATARERVLGAALGLLFLFLLNIARLCVMLLVGLHQRSWFDTFHTQIMPVVFVLAALGAWVFWAMRLGKSDSEPAAPT